MANTFSEDEWELCSDDGFVYKRRRRHRDPITSDSPPPSDHQHQQAHKKNILMRLKEQYNREIQQWETLLAMLQEIKDKIHPHTSPKSLPLKSTCLSSGENAVFREMIDDLLFQAETQEAYILDMDNLCNIAEAMCKAQEDRFKQSYIDLPTWETPRSLLATLSEVNDG